MRKTLLIASFTLLALIAGLGTWGALLPREHQATSRITVPVPPESVYNVMRDFAALPTWWHDVESMAPVAGTDGYERWRQTASGFSMTLILSEEDPPRRLVTVIDTTGGASFGGRWIHDVTLAPGGGATVTITEDGWVSNPFFRVMRKLGGPHATLDAYLTALGARFGGTVTPAHLAP